MLRLLVTFFTNPLLHFWTAFIVAGLLYWRGYSKLGKGILTYSLVWLFGVTISPLPQLLAERREATFSILDVKALTPFSEELSHIVVLGAGHSNASEYPIHERLSDSALKRILEGVRIKKELPAAKLLCSGYSSTGRQSQAEALAEMALVVGISPADTLLQPWATNTEEEARSYAQRFGGKDIPLVLVTSAAHLPRAMFWFRYYGLSPIPAPTNYLVKLNTGYQSFSWQPSVYKLEITEKLLHEYVGMLYARWKTK